MKEIIFVTTNKKKIEEVNDVLVQYGFIARQVGIDYPENKEDSIEQVCQLASRDLADKLGKSVIVEDTGLFFSAYNNFPGAMPKFVFNSIGYEGIFRLLKGKSRKAYFKSVFGYCEPGGKLKIIGGEVHGRISHSVHNKDKDCLAYDRIFRPDGYEITISDMTITEKNSISQRGKISHDLGRFLKDNCK